MTFKTMSLDQVAKEMNTHGDTPATEEAWKDQQCDRMTAQTAVFRKKVFQRTGSDQICQIRGGNGTLSRQFFKEFCYTGERKIGY